MDKTVKMAMPMSGNTSANVTTGLSRNEKGRTALHFACEMVSSVTARSLVEAGADVNARDYDGRTPLLLAVEGGFTNCVKLLLENGANPNVATNKVGMTALIAAAHKGHLECLSVLLKHGALINAKTKGGLTALIAASDSVEGCSGGCIQTLLEAGGEVNARTTEGTTALIHVVCNDCEEAAIALLDAGAVLNAVDGQGYSALHYGAQKNAVACIRMLLQRGADETRRFPPGRAPVEMAQPNSEGAQLLEESWKKLELEIARRAEELLLEDHLERQSNPVSTKPSSQHAQKKRNVKKKKKKKQQQVVVDEVDHGNKDSGSKDLESSPGMLSASDGTGSLFKTPFEVETKAREAIEQEEKWIVLVQRLELELKEARQAMQEQVKQLETATAAKTEMESQICNLEKVVASRKQALKFYEAENTRLKLQRSTSLGVGHDAGASLGSGMGMVRSASESSLFSMPSMPLQHLPFDPTVGPRTDRDDWYSLVPSPRPRQRD